MNARMQLVFDNAAKGFRDSEKSPYFFLFVDIAFTLSSMKHPDGTQKFPICSPTTKNESLGRAMTFFGVFALLDQLGMW